MRPESFSYQPEEVPKSEVLLALDGFQERLGKITSQTFENPSEGLKEVQAVEDDLRAWLEPQRDPESQWTKEENAKLNQTTAIIAQLKGSFSFPQ